MGKKRDKREDDEDGPVSKKAKMDPSEKADAQPRAQSPKHKGTCM